MMRRTALQLIAAFMSGRVGEVMHDEQKLSDAQHLTVMSNEPVTLMMTLQWKRIVVSRNGESVEIDQDELFQALKTAPKEQD